MYYMLIRRPLLRTYFTDWGIRIWSVNNNKSIRARWLDTYEKYNCFAWLLYYNHYLFFLIVTNIFAYRNKRNYAIQQFIISCCWQMITNLIVNVGRTCIDYFRYVILRTMPKLHIEAAEVKYWLLFWSRFRKPHWCIWIESKGILTTCCFEICKKE